jgi:hypothetical protein
MGEGVAALSRELREFMEAWKLDSVAATHKLPDGHTLTLRWTGPILSIERDDGAMVLLDDPKCDEA